MGDSEQWYWDLTKQQAVRASERGRGDQTMGPYESRAEAENWRTKVESRNESWDDADDDWSGDGEPTN
jgi:hypothetical protein